MASRSHREKQSDNSKGGKAFENLVHGILQRVLERHQLDEDFDILRNLKFTYPLPNAKIPYIMRPDIVIKHHSSGTIVAFVGCKRSLRERHIQDCFNRMLSAPDFPQSIWLEAFEREDETDTAKQCADVLKRKFWPFIPSIFAAGFCTRLPDTLQEAWSVLIPHLRAFSDTSAKPAEDLFEVLVDGGMHPTQVREILSRHTHYSIPKNYFGREE